MCYVPFKKTLGGGGGYSISVTYGKKTTEDSTRHSQKKKSFSFFGREMTMVCKSASNVILQQKG